MPRPVRALGRSALVLTLAVLLVTVPGATIPLPDDPVAAHRSTGCGLSPPHEPGAAVRYSLTSGGSERSYLLHLPPGYTEHRSWPVLLAYHGRGGSGERMAEWSGLTGLPAVVVLPDGLIGDDDRSAWQGAPYSPPGVDDVAFTRALLDTVEAGLCADRTRIHAVGMSNGGGFAALLACAIPDRVAAIATVAGAFYPHGLECDPARPVPIVSFHGTDDATTPYTGDVGRGLPDLARWNADRALANGCRSGPETTRSGLDVTVLEWSGCDQGAHVRHLVVDGGGHTWPGADVSGDKGRTTDTVEAHHELWRFLSRHHLPLNRTGP
ncbi:alpha/beta hydrolase-fold protein [Nocardiopsis sp. N85]|uniref:alpha/beta hydrolase family esterase n=1 Tax=Nocardiopsis sp. N85 TaxID=3029400 RepID=UPI00237EFA3C|nr:PHB depolymerase family esterase [Nocardiopsis sp. N85]MDE3724166.1 alpha/beta hydrolase-fold protein [Nocardiopsis sp. N85]